MQGGIDKFAEIRVDNDMGGIGELWQVPALNFMLSLSACLYPGKSHLNGSLNSLQSPKCMTQIETGKLESHFLESSPISSSSVPAMIRRFIVHAEDWNATLVS